MLGREHLASGRASARRVANHTPSKQCVHAVAVSGQVQHLPGSSSLELPFVKDSPGPSKVALQSGDAPDVDYALWTGPTVRNPCPRFVKRMPSKEWSVRAEVEAEQQADLEALRRQLDQDFEAPCHPGGEATLDIHTTKSNRLQFAVGSPRLLLDGFPEATADDWCQDATTITIDDLLGSEGEDDAGARSHSTPAAASPTSTAGSARAASASKAVTTRGGMSAVGEVESGGRDWGATAGVQREPQASGPLVDDQASMEVHFGNVFQGLLSGFRSPVPESATAAAAAGPPPPPAPPRRGRRPHNKAVEAASNEPVVRSSGPRGTTAAGATRRARHRGVCKDVLSAHLEVVRNVGKRVAQTDKNSGAIYANGKVISKFMKNNRVTRLLTRAEEIALAEQAAAFNDLVAVQGQLYPVLRREPTVEELALAMGLEPSEVAMRLHSGSAAREMLIRCNSKLVMSIAKKFDNQGVPLCDLIAAGFDGLRIAVSRYEPERGLRLSTVATWWIRQAASRMVLNDSRMIRLPTYLGAQLVKVRKLQKEVGLRDGREATLDELASAVKMTTEKFVRVMDDMRPAQSVVSSSQAVGESTILEEVLTDDRNVSASTFCENENMRKTLMSALGVLTEREQDVVAAHLGWTTEEGKLLSFGSIAEKHQMSRERCRQLFSTALTKMRQAASSLGLPELLESRRLAAREVMAVRTASSAKKSW